MTQLGSLFGKSRVKMTWQKQWDMKYTIRRNRQKSFATNRFFKIQRNKGSRTIFL